MGDLETRESLAIGCHHQAVDSPYLREMRAAIADLLVPPRRRWWLRWLP